MRCHSGRRMEIQVEDWGLVPYGEAWERQRVCFETLVRTKGLRLGGPCGAPAGSAGRIVLCEHPPVYTLGRSGRAENLLVSEGELAHMGAELYRIDRGGDITFHGPGQVVCYPILDLEALGLGLREYIHRLEEAVIRVCADYGVVGERVGGATGVWVSDKSDGKSDGRDEGGRAGQGAPRKICAIGVRASHSVTMHGLALNVSTDLGRFRCINPCGFTDRGVTSLCEETGREVAVSEVKGRLVEHLLSCLQKI